MQISAESVAAARDTARSKLCRWISEKIDPNTRRIELIQLEGGEIKPNQLVSLHLIDNPAAGFGVELGAPVASAGGSRGIHVNTGGGLDPCMGCRLASMVRIGDSCILVMSRGDRDGGGACAGLCLLLYIQMR